MCPETGELIFEPGVIRARRCIREGAPRLGCNWLSYIRKRFSMSGSHKKALTAYAILAISTITLPAFASQPANTTQQNQNYGYGDRVDRPAYGHHTVTVHDYMQ